MYGIAGKLAYNYSLPNSPDEEDSVKDGVPSVHVGVGVCVDEGWPTAILPTSLLSIDVLLSDRTSNCTSDNLIKYS